MINEADKVLDCLDRVIKGDSDPIELRAAVRAFLCSYAETRNLVMYDASDPASALRAPVANLADAILQGRTAYAFTDDGEPMSPGTAYMRPDGSRAVLTCIEIRSPDKVRDPVMLCWDDSVRLSAGLSGYRLPERGAS